MKRLLLGLLALLTLSVGLPATASPVEAASPTEESAFVSRINGLRSSLGLVPLQVDNELVTASRVWADQMAADDTLAHAPDITAGITAPWIKVGENVGVGGDVDSLFDAFVASPLHYANLVDPDFRYVGIGVTFANGKLWTTHRFMALADIPTTTTAPPTTTAPTTTAPTTVAPTTAPLPTTAPTTAVTTPPTTSPPTTTTTTSTTTNSTQLPEQGSDVSNPPPELLAFAPTYMDSQAALATVVSVDDTLDALRSVANLPNDLGQALWTVLVS
ncbi:MAG: CAP domain-containing protein [Actinomycetia bacterium]|nr:CAP domain-containing protein [Actinomycetes bacterium]